MSDVEIVVRPTVNVVFSPREIEVIRAHFSTQERPLPPGLQKKVTRGGQLPAGWQRKMEPFPASLDRILTPLPGNYRRGVIEGQAVIYDPLTHVDLRHSAVDLKRKRRVRFAWHTGSAAPALRNHRTNRTSRTIRTT